MRHPILVAMVIVTGATVRLGAHDPGLSALDVTIADDRIDASLCVAIADVATLRQNHGSLASVAGAFARHAIHIEVDGRALASTVRRVQIQDTSVEVQLAFERATGGLLTVSSDVPRGAPAGHRELVTVKAGDRLLSGTLLDAGSGAIAVTIRGEASVDRHRALPFVRLGVLHILSGYDHLVFLGGLLLAARRLRQSIGVLSAFTVAHSLTLALAASGLVHLPSSIVEPLIALSIAYVGIETLLWRERGPNWRVVFVCGLIHGLGFAGALLDLGLGETVSQFVVSLLSFNVGVEAGQLLVAALALPIVRLLRTWPSWHTKLAPACSISVALAGGYWLVQRLLG